MKKLFYLITLTLLMVGCSAKNENTTGNYQMPPELSGCKVFRLEGEGLSKTLYVVKCPNSTTSTSWQESSGGGKHRTTRTYSVSLTSE